MTTLSTFCRITGHARNLPKPCYFPLLPPMSPADAKKLCRITGRATDAHNYSPIIAFGKPYHFDGLEGCKITQHENLTFARPIFIKNKDNEKSIESLTELLTKMKNKRKKKVDVKRLFVYKVNNQSTGLVLPPELEEAIRTGEIETLAVSKDVGHINLKIKEGRIVKVQMQSITNSEINEEDNLYYGEGQSKEVIEEQQKILNQRNQRKQETMARKKLFEQKEQKAEEDEKLATERPKSKKKCIKFDPLKRKQKMEKMTQMIEEQQENSAIILPKFDSVSKVNPDEQIWYEQMLEDIAKAQKTSFNVTTVFASKADWAEMEKTENAGFEWDSFPHEEVCESIEITVIDIETSDLSNIPSSHTLDIAASVETIEPAPLIEKALLKGIKDIKEEDLKATQNIGNTFKEIDSSKLIPSIDDIEKVISQQDLTHGYLVRDEDGKGCKFIEKSKFIPGKELSVSGAMVTIDNEQRFVIGQIIHLAQQESFVAGQTVETSHGNRFVPGQTIVNKSGEITFIPGQCVSVEDETKFVAGHIIENAEESKFMPGQVIDRGDKKPIFMPGQTILTENGPKFVPGEVNIDTDGYQEFVPGMKMPSSKGEMFIPGQAFQSNEGISFTPGQIVETEEGPSFIPGKNFQTPEGNKKFVRGEMKKTDDGKIAFEISKMDLEIPIIKEDLIESDDEFSKPNKELIIPNDDLQLIAVPPKDIVGFLVKPTNTSNIQAGENLYGDIVETDDSVLFYLNGKLPKDISDADKVITGELVVGETSQKFVPGKMMNTVDGEKFIPGQSVKTNNGEEFVPGQIVETVDGPKFIPGQMVNTSEGEKFIPGQVVVEEDGPKFVPGHIIQTKNGATFIPGQMMSTDKGQKFVPGQLVETKEGPRFVPGQVVESNEGPKFVSGTVVETEDGLKYLPNVSNTANNVEESEEESEISFQGFDISPEEIQLLSHNMTNARPRSPITREDGLIDSSTLKKLATDTMEVHGRTPEPGVDKKKKNKKKGKITIDVLDEEDEKEDVEIEDPGTQKVEILKHLIKAGSTLSSLRKDKEIRILGELLNIDESYNENEAEIEAIKYINSKTTQDDLFESYIGNDEQLVSEILSAIGNPENVVRNDQVTNVVNDAVKKCITQNCDAEIEELINKIRKNPESLFTDCKAQILLTEAVGIVCVTGDIEVASLLEKFISEPNNPNCLKEDKDVLSVLRQLLVLHRIAERDPDVAKVLKELQEDPEGVKDRNKVRKLIREAKSLLVKETKATNKPFDVRHVLSSKDIPSAIFEQIRQDKKEAEMFMEKLPDELFKAIMGDERCGGKLMEMLDNDSTGRSSKDIDKFKKGMAVVVAKDNMQAVIPRHFARSIYYGIMPYILIDEEGFKFFERGLTGRKLAPSRVIENTWFQPDSYYENSVLYPQQVTPSGMQYNLVLLGDAYRKNAPSLQYTSLLPSSGPKRISYSESQRRASREGSITPLRRSSRSTTPSRRFSTTSIHDPYPSGADSFSRRSSIGLNSYSLPRGMSPIPNLESEMSTINSYAVTPYIGEEESDHLSIARSGTVGKLLDKYSSYSSSKRPTSRYSKYNTANSYSEKDEDLDDEGYSAEERRYLPPSTTKYRTPSLTPEKQKAPDGRDSQERFGSLSSYEVPTRSKRSLQRPFSDIYEMDEVDSPTSESRPWLRNSLGDSANTKYDGLDSKRSPKPSESRLSYSDRLKDWKTKQNMNTEDEEQTPRRISHNRYESVLTGEDDYLPREKGYKKPSYLSKITDNDDDDDDDDDDILSVGKHKKHSYSSKLDDDDDDDILSVGKHKKHSYSTKLDDDGEDDILSVGKHKKHSYSAKLDDDDDDDILSSGKHLAKKPSYSSKLGDDDDFSEEKYRNTLRQKYSQGLQEMNKNLNIAYKAPSPNPPSHSRFGKTDLNKLEDYETPRKTRQYNGSRSDSVAPRRYGNKEDDTVPGVKKKTSLDLPNDTLNNGSAGGYASPYGYSGGYGGAYGQSLGYGQPPPYNNPMGYGQPLGYGQPSGYSTPSMYGYQPPQYNAYGPSMYGGAGMNMYSPRTPYGGTTQPRYGESLHGGYSPMSRYGGGMSTSPNSSTGYNRIPYGGTSYGGGKRLTTSLNLDDDEDDDEDMGSYDPKRNQRSLASKLAKKYIGDSDVDDD